MTGSSAVRLSNPYNLRRRILGIETANSYTPKPPSLTAEAVSFLCSPGDTINPPSQEGSSIDVAIPVQLQIANLDGFDAGAPPTVKASPCCVEAVGEVQTNIEEGAKYILGDAVLGRGRVCITCDARFHTFSSLREHERSHHPELLVREVEYHPSAVSMKQQLEEMAAYEIKRGSNIKTMARDLEPVSQISPATPSSHSPVPCSSPTPITSSSADLTVEDPPGCLVGSKPISLPLRSPCTTEVPTTPYRQDRSSSRSPYTTEVPLYYRDRRSMVEHPPCRAPQISPSVNPDETTVERVLTLVSPEFTQNYADTNLQVWDNASVLDTIIPEQISILSSPPKRLPPLSPPVSRATVRPISGDPLPLSPVAAVQSFVRTVFAKQLRSRSRYPLEQWLDKINIPDPAAWVDTIEDMLLLLFPLDERAKQKKVSAGKSAANNGAANRNQKRMADYKSTQDLYAKDRKRLADKIASGEPLDVPTIYPEMSAIMEVHGNVFLSESPPDDHPFQTPSASIETEFSPVSAEEVSAAKKGWPRSAPGRDGVTVPAVSKCNNNILAARFNLILVSRYQPVEWRAMRTVLIPKPGKNRKDASNWRPITIGSSIQRLFHRILANRLSSLVRLNSNQRGFVKTDGTLANTLILDSLINGRTQARKGTSMISMDIRKAFDSVSHHSIIRGLRRFQISPYLINYIQATLTSSSTIFCVGQKESESVLY
ncbi:uncharacterized protein LOC135142177 [Zophobas morio]|uniref:uncharacterized protein LOC135142177 n=1 Tax=Zophobas morio TaxID=2755281 RepID=UPI0030835CBB